jgi:hypothetical protein
MPTLMDNQPQTPSLSHKNSPYQTSLNLRSRPRKSAFRIYKKRERESSKLTPKDSERSEDVPDKTETVSTDSKTLQLALKNLPTGIVFIDYADRARKLWREFNTVIKLLAQVQTDT